MRHRLLGVLIMGVAALGGVLPAQAADNGTGHHGKMLGIVRPRDAAAPATAGYGPLYYHKGGAVQTGPRRTYAIYWGNSFSPTYQTDITGYFQNVATASGQTSNVYYSDTQYYQTIGGTTTYITYAEQFGASVIDTNAFPANGCTDSYTAVLPLHLSAR